MNGAADKKREAGLAEKLAWLRLARTGSIGAITFHNLLQRYGGAQEALDALPGIAARGRRAAPFQIPSLAAAEKEYEPIRKLGADIILACEADYPLPLAATEDAPPVLCFKGRRELLARPAIGIVGARNASAHGRRFAQRLAAGLGQAGLAVASGLARGIDTAAHEGSLATGTVAVVAGGIDVVYPPENRRLHERIAEEGLILAENPPGMPPRARDFPRRNRIVSGLSSGVVVVEATERSGSLITARLAGEQGRDVYAVPGHPLDPRAEGPNRLIREGAVLVRNAADVLENINGFGLPRGPDTYNSMCDGAAMAAPLPPLELVPQQHDGAAVQAALLAELSLLPADIDELARQAGVNVASARIVLMDMEISGTVQRLPGNRVVLLPA
jgi:DNA processing protein